jgi:hypothetical protein
MNALSDQQDRDLVMKVLFEEMYSVPLPERGQCRWVMDAEMWRMLRRLFPPPADILPYLSGDGMVMLGHPVELRSGVKGVRYERIEG